MSSIKIDDLGKAIQKIIDDYSEEANDVVEEVIPKVGKKAVNELKKKSPKQTKRYAKGWKSKQEKERLSSKVIVYNKDRYQLTHLLEKGHANRGGGRTSGIPHIKPVEENVSNEAIRLIREGIERI